MGRKDKNCTYVVDELFGSKYDSERERLLKHVKSLWYTIFNISKIKKIKKIDKIGKVLSVGCRIQPTK